MELRVAGAAVLSAVAEVGEGCVGRTVSMQGCSWVEYCSVCWGMEAGVRMFLAVVQTLASVYLCARRTRIRREQAEVNLPFQDLK